MNENLNRAARQWGVWKWLMKTFGPTAANRPTRVQRFLEEALELARAADLDRAQALALVEYVYARPSGEAGQKIGGVALTLMGLAQALELDVYTEEMREWHRVQAATGVDPQ